MKNLHDLRIDHDLTQQQMAEYLGVSRPTYSNYETDVHDPGPDVLRKLADFFHVSIDYLLDYTPKEAHASMSSETAFLSRRERKLLCGFRSLDEAGQYRVERCVETELDLQQREAEKGPLKKNRKQSFQTT